MKTKIELAKEFTAGLYVSGEVHELNVARTAFLAGYKVAMKEIAELPLDKAVEVIIHEANKEGVKILGMEKLFYEENTGNYYRTIKAAKEAAKKAKVYFPDLG